jgi:hypothetical protein
MLVVCPPEPARWVCWADRITRQAGPASSCQTTLATAWPWRHQPFLGVDEVVVVVSTDVICTQLILPVNRLSLAV